MTASSNKSTAANIDLQRERAAANICSEEVAEWWAGGREALQKRRALEKLFFEDPAFNDPLHISQLSHKELFEHSMAKGTRFLVKLRAWYEAEQQRAAQEKATTKSSIESMYEFRFLLSGPLGTALFQQSFPLRLHFSMFLPALLGQCTEEQQRVWLEKAWRLDGIVGTYAQTELGHGTFIRGLETRADYDAEHDEFILNTPSLSAYKFWPGGLGHAANMAVVLAQLYVKGKHYGLHPFLVRIRNEETHMPEPGVDVGEIGPKIGSNGVNNGFLGLKDVRIPRTQMLMKNAQVLAGGKFVKGPEPLLTYGTMVFVRVMIVRDVSFCLLQAATIATRYSAVRRQSPIEPNQPEPQIIDHLTQQAKLFPSLAKGVFFRLAADVVWRMYQDVMQELNAGNRRNLPELHALSCCLKAVCSHDAGEGIEILRKACGGHGYLSSSNLPQIYGMATAACTYEGENTVLLLQTARYLIKSFVDGIKRKFLPKSVAYLRATGRQKLTKDFASHIAILEYTAMHKVREAFDYQRMKRKQLAHQSENMASNLSGLKLIQAATAHGRAYLARVAYEETQKLRRQVTPPLGDALEQLAQLFVYDMCLSSMADILRYNDVTARDVAALEARYEESLLAFRRNAVAFVDGFDFHDRVLGSTLGCYDGHVYERIMEEARKSPLNQEPVNASFETHLKPFLKGKL